MSIKGIKRRDLFCQKWLEPWGRASLYKILFSTPPPPQDTNPLCHVSNKDNVETSCKRTYLESFATSFNACSYDETPLRSIDNEKKPRVKKRVSLKFSELNLQSSSLFRPNPFEGGSPLTFFRQKRHNKLN